MEIFISEYEHGDVSRETIKKRRNKSGKTEKPHPGRVILRGVVVKMLKNVRNPIKPDKTKRFCEKRAEHPRIFAENTEKTVNNGKTGSTEKQKTTAKTEKTAQNSEKDKKNVRNEITSPILNARMHAF